MEIQNMLDRLENYMKFSKLNNNEITVKANLSVGLLGKAFKSRKGLNSDSIEKILRAYPNLNGHWLLTGVGSMLTSEPELPTVAMDAMQKEIEALRKENARLKDELLGLYRKVK